MLFRNLLILAFMLFVSLSSFAQTNIRISPIHLLVGMPRVEADFKIADSWTIGPTGSYLNRSVDQYDVQAYSLGIRANYFFNREVFTQGWYLGPSLEYAHVHITDNDPFSGKMEGNGSGLALSVIGGYQWMWDNFNINLGAGPSYYSLGTVEVESSDGTVDDDYTGYDGLQLAVEFTLGWKF